MTKCISLRIWPKSEIISVFPRNTGKSFFVEVHFQKVIVLIWSTVQQIHKRLCVTRNENWKNTSQIESPQKTHNFIYKYIWLLLYENPVLMILISTCLKHMGWLFEYDDTVFVFGRDPRSNQSEWNSSLRWKCNKYRGQHSDT